MFQTTEGLQLRVNHIITTQLLTSPSDGGWMQLCYHLCQPSLKSFQICHEKLEINQWLKMRSQYYVSRQKAIIRN